MEGSNNGGKNLRRKTSSIWQRAKNKIRITPKDATPVNWKIIGLVFISMFTGTLSLTFLFPFLPEMILFFGYQETDKGYYAGMVASMVFAGRAAGSFFWGWLSDKMGRRPVMLMTIFGNGFFCLLFGFTSNLPMALIIRFLAGLANGTASISKAILYEVSDDSNQATGLSIVAMSWGAGIILGPAVGGILSNPASRYPSMFQKDGVFDQFPYLLPSLIVACVCFVVILVDFLVLPETRSRKQLELDVEEQTEELHKLVHKTQQKQTKETDRKISLSMEDLHCYTDRAVYDVKLYQSCQDLRRSCDLDTNKALKTPTENTTEEAVRVEKKISKCIFNEVKSTSLFEILSTPDCRKAIFLYTVFSFSSIGYEEIFTIWASTKTNYDGLGFETDEIGMVLGLSSFPMLILNLFIYPFLDRIFGTKKTFIICGCINGILMTVTPMLHLIESSSPSMLWTILLVLIVPQKIMTSCLFTASSLFINNSSPPHMAGSVNGIATTSTAIARTLAPTIGGSIFAWSIGNNLEAPFDVNLPFFIFGFILWLISIYSLFMPESLNRKKT
ncbi:uncharacterized protein LOC134258806 [Saccostrea cucullata]|uniref:uncharacterized protein LOC134258806 n=1 Tax=Saccostrea cuccullata TaxID=36930 RepID=UPI002ED3D60A